MAREVEASREKEEAATIREPDIEIVTPSKRHGGPQQQTRPTLPLPHQQNNKTGKEKEA